MSYKSNVNGGFVYIIKNKNGEFKVGNTIDIKKRLSSIRCGCPSANLVFKSEVLNNRNEVERFVHKKLSTHRVGGEWFRCSENHAVKTVKDAIVNIGLFAEEGQTTEIGGIQSDIELSNLQTVGILCRINAVDHHVVIERYIAYLKSTNLEYLGEFTNLSLAEQFLKASTVLANTFIRDEKSVKELIDKVQGKLNFDGDK